MITTYELADKDYAWAVGVARKWCGIYSVRFDDDARQTARQAVWSVVPRFEGKATDSVAFRRFAVCRVVGALKDFVRDRMGTRSGQKRFDKAIRSLDEIHLRHNGRYGSLAPLIPIPPAPTHFFRDRVLAACWNERERDIVGYLADGYLLSDLVPRFGVSISRLSQIITKIKERMPRNRA